MKRIIIGAIMTGLLLAFGIGFASAGKGGPTSETTVFEKQGRRVEVKGEKPVEEDVQAPPEYDPSPRGWRAHERERSAIERVVRASLKAEREALRQSSRVDKSARERSIAPYYDAEAGEFDRRLKTLTRGDKMADGLGYEVVASGITRCTILGISATSTDATVVADVWSWTMYKNRAESDPTERTSKAANGRQHTYTLTKSADGWRIAADQWVFIPGSEP